MESQISAISGCQGPSSFQYMKEPAYNVKISGKDDFSL